jgi:ribokinase
MSVKVQEEWLKETSPDATRITLDSFWWQPGSSAYAHLSVLSRISALLPSKAEVSAFFDGDFTLTMVTTLVDLGAPLVVVKLGRDGCAVLQAGGRIVELPTCATKVSDPTGAGDAFCGGFLVGLTDCGDPVEAALRGTVSASFAVEGFGLSRLLSVDPAEARDRLRELRSTVTT